MIINDLTANDALKCASHYKRNIIECNPTTGNTYESMRNFYSAKIYYQSTFDEKTGSNPSREYTVLEFFFATVYCSERLTPIRIHAYNMLFKHVDDERFSSFNALNCYGPKQ